MTPDLVRLLVTRYPLIFPADDFPPRSGVGNGWFNLLDSLFERLQFRSGPTTTMHHSWSLNRSKRNTVSSRST